MSSGMWKNRPQFINTTGDGEPPNPGGGGMVAPVVAVIFRFPLFHSSYYDYDSLIMNIMMGKKSIFAPEVLDGTHCRVTRNHKRTTLFRQIPA
jgi:hypothetical protein